MSIRIESMKASDIHEVTDLIIRTLIPRLRTEGLDEQTIKEVTARHTPEWMLTKMQKGHYFVALDEQKIIGVIGLRTDDGMNTPHRISSFYVDPDYQQKGVGRKLYQQIEKFAKENGCTKLDVSSSTMAEPVYTHFGFKKTGETHKTHVNGQQSVNIIMEKQL